MKTLTIFAKDGICWSQIDTQEPTHYNIIIGSHYVSTLILIRQQAEVCDILHIFTNNKTLVNALNKMFEFSSIVEMFKFTNKSKVGGYMLEIMDTGCEITLEHKKGTTLELFRSNIG